MKQRTPILLTVIILLPVTLLTWFGVRDQQNQQMLLDHQLSRLAENQLLTVDQQLQNHFYALQAQLLTDARLLQQSSDGRYRAELLRDYLKRSPGLQQLFVLSAGGDRLYPPRNLPLTRQEQAFIDSSGSLLGTPELFRLQSADPQPARSPPQQPSALSPESQAADVSRSAEPLYSASLRQAPVPRSFAPALGDRAESSAEEHPGGWIAWHVNSGVRHVFWWQDRDGNILGFSLSAARLLSDLINLLPDEGRTGDIGSGAEIRLLNSRDEVLYSWGSYRTDNAEVPLRLLPLSHPLGSWRLAWFAPPVPPAGTGIGMAALLLLLTAGLATLAWLLYREHGRELRLAEQRVNFVNQVSHELKTPLTNVRLYAEMLEQQLLPEEDDPLPRRYLGVIASESQRLSRLIENVLSFSRIGRGTLKISPQPAAVDNQLQRIIETFTPALQDRQIQVRFHGNAKEQRSFDTEALEQILNNLLSNCEKYAADGRFIDISSWQDADSSYIRVRDYGPGIAEAEGERIFRPFHRISNRLTGGVSGTGIGLGLARDLARAHGGELSLEAPDKQAGASFLLTLPASPVADPASTEDGNRA